LAAEAYQMGSAGWQADFAIGLVGLRKPKQKSLSFNDCCKRRPDGFAAGEGRPPLHPRSAIAIDALPMVQGRPPARARGMDPKRIVGVTLDHDTPSIKPVQQYCIAGAADARIRPSANSPLADGLQLSLPD
jgi:hypothetical protein